MKKIVAFLLIITVIAACKKEYDSIYTFSDKTNKASVKFVHAVANVFPPGSTTAQAGLQIYLNDAKITGSAITYGGGVFPGLEYALVPSGNLTLKANVPAGGTTPETNVLTAPLDLAAGKTYTVFIADTLPALSILKVEEDLSLKADSGKYFVRLVNLTSKNAGYDLFSVSDNALVVPNVAYKTASNFVQLPAGTGARSFAVRKTSTTVNDTTISITPVAGRMYTIMSIGVDGVRSGVRSRRLTFFTTRFQQ